MAEFYIQQSKPRWLIVPVLIAFVGMLIYVLPDKQPKVQERQKIDMSGSTGDFIKKFSKTAVTESKAFKIPASVILAVAASNSECYDHPEHHNMFYLPPDTNWEGQVITYATQDGGQYTLKKYDTAWGSFRDFSITVLDMTSAQGIDVKGLTVAGWLYVLQDNAMCDAQAVKSIIDKYDLTILDTVK